MATSKTLTPTNVTIQIPDFTDQPDQRMNSNCMDKEADAINALNGNLNGLKVKAGTVASGSTVSVTYETCAFINCFRGATSAIPVVAFCDGWSGVVYAHQNNSLCTISVSNRTITITNTANAYVTYFIQYV